MTESTTPRRRWVKLMRWLVLAVVMVAAGAFVAELLRPRRPTVTGAAGSGYLPPQPAADRYVVLPRDR